MSGTGFAYPNLFGKTLPAPAPRWAGNAKYNFIGGHNDRTLIPVEGLIEAAAALRKVTFSLNAFATPLPKVWLSWTM